MRAEARSARHSIEDGARRGPREIADGIFTRGGLDIADKLCAGIASCVDFQGGPATIHRLADRFRDLDRSAHRLADGNGGLRRGSDRDDRLRRRAPVHSCGRMDDAQSPRAEHEKRYTNALATIEIALAAALVATGGSLWSGLNAAKNVDLGYRADHIAVMTFDPGQLGYSETRTRAFYRELMERVHAARSARCHAGAECSPGNDRRAETDPHRAIRTR